MIKAFLFLENIIKIEVIIHGKFIYGNEANPHGITCAFTGLIQKQKETSISCIIGYKCDHFEK
jgi:hypothetical protein